MPQTARRKSTFRQRMLDDRNRRSANIEDRRRPPEMAPFDSAGYPFAYEDVRTAYGQVPPQFQPDLYQPVPRAGMASFDRQQDALRYYADYQRQLYEQKRRGLR
jgi:hypothetical protein